MSLENLPAWRKLLLVFAALFAVAAAFLAATAGAGRMAAGSGLKVGEALAPLGDAAMEIQLEGALARIIARRVSSGYARLTCRLETGQTLEARASLKENHRVGDAVRLGVEPAFAHLVSA